MLTHTLQDGDESFQVSVHQHATSSTIVLFAAGTGGLPERYSTLLNVLAESGCTVVAPHFERIRSPKPTEEELMLRAKRLSLTVDTFADTSARVVGVGHSIGATTLVAMAGGQMWLGPGQRINVATDNRLTRLALLAPPTGFFRAPEALNKVKLPILLWVGSEDTITPPAQSEWLAHTISDWNKVDLHITEGASHFSFMDNIPPHATEPLANKLEFLKAYSTEISKFVVS